jgi:zinc protease
MTFLKPIAFTILLACANLAMAGPRIPLLPFEKYTLPNGLQVILHEDHSTPLVTVNVWYHVGAKNEQPGRTGFAHLFEHMMFQGSKHQKGYFGPLQQAGGRLNGSTNQDCTNYWETVPANYLALALWMESDRMGFLLPAMTQAKLDNQRDVVKNERRQSYDNQPCGLAYETILAALYPPEHPYSWPTVGSMVDLDKASRKDVAAFFRRYYHPANASLCIAGDFHPVAAKQLVAKYFGPIPAGPKVAKLKPMPVQLKTESRIRMTDRVGLPRLYMAWPTVPAFAADAAELDILEDVLAANKTGRLYRSLVRNKQIAQDVNVAAESEELTGRLFIIATARPGHTPAELEKAIVEQLRCIQDQPPSAAEVSRAVNRIEARLLSSLESASGFEGRADRLNKYNVFTGTPGYLASDFQRYLDVTPQGVQRIAKKYLGPNRVVLEMAPGPVTKITPDPRITAEQAREKLAKAVCEPPLPSASPPSEDHDRQTLPKPAPAVKFALPPFQHARLSNGMEVVIVEKHQLPTVAMNLVLRAGRSSDPATKVGLANLLAAVWQEGTTHRTEEQLTDELAAIGASLNVTADWDSSTVGLRSLKRHLPKALDVYADVLRNPAFPEKELAREKNMALGRMVEIRDDATTVAQLGVAAALYGPAHPYGQPPYGMPAMVRAITRADLQGFYRAHVRPEQTTLIAVGDVTPAELVPELERVFAGWKAIDAETSAATLAVPPAAKPTRILLVDKPGAAQSVIAVSQIGVARTSPDYYALTVMNSIFGGQFSSRLNLNLRESKGYTYGARTVFEWRIRQPGLFQAIASVHTAATAPALVEFLKEFQGMAGDRPVSPKELEFSKAYLTCGYPADFETSDQIASRLKTLVEYCLPDDFYNTYTARIKAVSAGDVLRAAKKYLDLDHLAIVIVADGTKVEASLRELPAGKEIEVVQFDKDFHLVPATQIR